MNVLIYAVGGGHGHAMRGAALGRRLLAEGCRVTLLVRAGSQRYFRENESSSSLRISSDDWSAFDRSGYDVIVVDTFPRGWKGEITEDDLSTFERSIFVARYNRALDFASTDVFDEIWDPTPAEKSEWSGFPRAQAIGYLVDEDRYTFEPAERELLVLDPSSRLSELGKKIVDRAEGLGWRASIRSEIPRKLMAEKILIVGAGYNTFYETREFHDRIRFVPLAKRYDDQARRAGELAVTSLAELEAWLVRDHSSESSGSAASVGKSN